MIADVFVEMYSREPDEWGGIVKNCDGALETTTKGFLDKALYNRGYIKIDELWKVWSQRKNLELDFTVDKKKINDRNMYAAE